ncbi:probable E3 ubiquitin-protein ligase DTX3 [Mercenaria mercenaria]|uniref:probable E3 ubiquitin-protein ligase DTX3 n=1 Tax=Mercenaria mercenaria TaxID=6596 RepID=UPI00234E510D|nr:probable E3 ubiquitin-protein ligase DTX3 [Mercenaria mercenaria]
MRQSGNSKLEVHLVLRNGQYIGRVCSTFDTFVRRQQEVQQNVSAVGGMKDSASEYHPEPMETGDENAEDCVICMDEMKKPRTLQCGHKFCVSCIERHFEIKKTCPTCGAVCGIITGDQPDGYMQWNFNAHKHCAGYPNCGQISITYTFPNGVQGPNHPNPGSWYRGITRTAFLPDNQEGRKILQMLDTAFKRKLVFTIGSSRTTGQEGVITWNDIHHKTDHRPNTQELKGGLGEMKLKSMVLFALCCRTK